MDPGVYPAFPLRGRRSAAPLALLLGRTFSGQNKIKQAEEVYRQALQDFGSTSCDWDAIATLLREYVRLVRRRGKLREARGIYQPVIKRFVFRFGRNHHTTLVLIYETANALWASGALSDAETVYLEAITDLNPGKQNDSIILLDVMHELGVVYMQLHRWTDAESLLHAALQGFLHKHRNYYHLQVVAVVLHLGTTFREQGKLKDAAQMFQWGSSGLHQAHGPGHADTIDAFDQLSCIHIATENFVDANFALQSSIEGCDILYGKVHDLTLRKKVRFAGLLRDQGQFLEAQEVCEQLLGECGTLQNQWKFCLLNYLGTIHSMAGDFDKAEEEFAAALTGLAKEEGRASPAALLVLYNMGNTHHMMGNPDLAEVTYREAMVGLRHTVGHNHIASVAAAEMLALSLMSQGKVAEAANFLAEMLNLCRTEVSYPITELQRNVAVNFEWMTTSSLPAYDKGLLRWTHDGDQQVFLRGPSIQLHRQDNHC
ncbi:TPR repeat protein [Cordyceps javanica]|uniref:TPR repeat protein n=1 Tax=Cordyceps javanica TaxID=43265 RepID=A0A545VIS4_9HYPO|nr:TPR repeat protein [Cordyceps javanica]TQW01633.1 TPR repeat protein [Cordyceps javanica]